MKRLFLVVFFILYLSSSAFSAVELDADFNGAVDVDKGGTNVQTVAGQKTALSIPTDTVTELSGKEPLKGADDNYVTDAEKIVIGNTSGTNTGDMSDAEVKTAYENNADTNAFTDAYETIINFITVTQAVDLDVMESDIATNNAKVTEQDTGTNTGDDPADDTAYDATSWNDNTDSATKNAIRDKIETMGGAFDPASPGEIGGTTPDIVNATALNIPFVDGEADTGWLDFNTAYTPPTGFSGTTPYIDNLYKVLDGSLLGIIPSIDDTAGDGDTTVTWSADKIFDELASISGVSVTYQTADPVLVDMSEGDIICARTSGDVFIKGPLGGWTLDGVYAADPVIPTLTSWTIQTNGTDSILVFSEAMTFDTGGSGGFATDTPTEALTYGSGATTDTVTFTHAVINSPATDNPVGDFIQPSDGWQSVSGSVDLASFQDVAVVNNSTQTPSTCDDCSGNLSIAWHMENTDLTLGTPCGCSDGDTTATLNNAVISGTQFSDGSNSLYCASTAGVAHNAELANTGQANPDIGTVTFDFYITEFGISTEIFSVFNAVNDKLSVYMTGADEPNIDIALWYQSSTSNIVVYLNTPAEADLSLNTWYTFTGKWRTVGSPNLSAQITGKDEDTDDTELTAFSDNNPIYVGNRDNARTGKFYIDNLKIYTTWE